MKIEGFKIIGRFLLEVFVVRDMFNIKEVDLFKVVDKWVINECERLRLMVDGMMKRLVLGDKVV